MKTKLRKSIKSFISHNWQDESPEAKARWFQSLSLEERIEILSFFTDIILENNPDIVERKHVKPSTGRVRIVRRTQG